MMKNTPEEALRPTMVRFTPPSDPASPGRQFAGRLIQGALSLFVLLFTLYVGVILPGLDSVPRSHKRAAACMNNLKQLGTAFVAYTQDYDDQLPPRDRWCDTLLPLIKSAGVFQCPELSGVRSGYGYSEWLGGGGMKYHGIPDLAGTVLFFDARGGLWNLNGGFRLVDKRHEGSANIAFTDGHVKRVADLDSLQWEPGLVPKAPVQQLSSVPWFMHDGKYGFRVPGNSILWVLPNGVSYMDYCLPGYGQPPDHSPQVRTGSRVTVRWSASLLVNTNVRRLMRGPRVSTFRVGKGRTNWEQAMLGMRVEDCRIITVPPKLGFNPTSPVQYQPNCIQYDVELLKIR